MAFNVRIHLFNFTIDVTAEFGIGDLISKILSHIDTERHLSVEVSTELNPRLTQKGVDSCILRELE